MVAAVRLAGVAGMLVLTPIGLTKLTGFSLQLEPEDCERCRNSCSSRRCVRAGRARREVRVVVERLMVELERRCPGSTG